ncbi:MAG: hypothetical protein Pg6C_11400 [Treponemataceae bacterium]|nr:MAG: hypothetical protein Pg6C_11400 [Treponemataceae bacterium]
MSTKEAGFFQKNASNKLFRRRVVHGIEENHLLSILELDAFYSENADFCNDIEASLQDALWNEAVHTIKSYGDINEARAVFAESTIGNESLDALEDAGREENPTGLQRPC